MASLKRLFERHSEGTLGITTESEWRGFESDVVGFGLSTAALTQLLARVWAQAHASGRGVTYADLVTGAAADSADGEAEKIVQDLKQDSSALKRYVDYVRVRYKKDSGERLSLEHGKSYDYVMCSNTRCLCCCCDLEWGVMFVILKR